MASEREKFAARLNQALDEAGLPSTGQRRQVALARVLDVSVEHVGRWLGGEDFPQTSQLVRLAQYLGVRSNWLLSGVGERYARQPDALPVGGSAAEVAVAEPSGAGYEVVGSMLSKEAFEIALAWMKLPPPQRQALRQLIVELARGTQ